MIFRNWIFLISLPQRRCSTSISSKITFFLLKSSLYRQINIMSSDVSKDGTYIGKMPRISLPVHYWVTVNFNEKKVEILKLHNFRFPFVPSKFSRNKDSKNIDVIFKISYVNGSNKIRPLNLITIFNFPLRKRDVIKILTVHHVNMINL